MRLTLVASLVLCGFFCAGCESLNKTARFPGKKPAMPEQLANDLKRREASEKLVSQDTLRGAADRSVQQANFTPAAGPPSEIDAVLLQAKQAEQAQQNQVAKTLYDQVLQKQPQNAEAHHRLGVLADQEGRYPEAQAHYQAAIKQEPQNASLLSDIGYSYYSQDRLNDAEKYLNQALLIQPGNQYARNNLAHVYGRRAQQTGSANDYKDAQEQFVLALGPQGAEDQMKQLFPQGGSPQVGATSDKRGLLNPFKKSDKGATRTGSLLQAPKPKSEDGNEKLLKQMAEIREKMEKAGELHPKRPGSDAAMGSPVMNGGRNSQAPVPYNQMNQVLSDIDHEAEIQRTEVLRQSYPERQRGGTPATPAGWNQPDRIQQVGGDRNDPRDGYGAPRAQDGGNRSGARDGFGQPNGSDYPNPNGGYGQGYPDGGPQANFNEPNRAGAYNSNQDGREPGFDNAVPDQGRNVRQVDRGYAPSWPDAAGSPTQFDSRGNTWDGQSVINDSQLGRDSNINGQNDPTYRTGGGQAFGPQRPNAGNRANPAGRNEGRQAAAQLGLDAGMGEMFPGGETDAGMNGVNQQGYQQTNPRNGPSGGYNWNTDPSMNPIPTTQRGMPPGGNGMMAPADYSYSQPGYQNNGYSQGVTPAMGDNFGQQGGDVSAPWNQSSTMQRNSRPVQQMQYGNDTGAASGRFAPSRPAANPQSQNFGAPPMYYGR
ncbi:MAG: Tetratricopeptide 1 repeat-containing protein [Planctomycetaceae bacterium]|nr:Tetratricopeptide 1 repeat-containing protein [Planctomycetaceae bacterium]